MRPAYGEPVVSLEQRSEGFLCVSFKAAHLGLLFFDQDLKPFEGGV